MIGGYRTPSRVGHPVTPLRFAYELESDLVHETFTVRAVADLDCDGETSLREISGSRSTLAGSIPGLFVENELE
jgi:hypothetical protein